MSLADYWVLGGTILAFFAIILVHERREFRRQDLHELAAQAREDRAIERHDREMGALNHNRALTLAAIDQRSRLEPRVEALEHRVKKLEGL